MIYYCSSHIRRVAGGGAAGGRRSVGYRGPRRSHGTHGCRRGGPPAISRATAASGRGGGRCRQVRQVPTSRSDAAILSRAMLLRAILLGAELSSEKLKVLKRVS
eukprot:8512057-Pyramimonas_sp.AAC.1